VIAHHAVVCQVHVRHDPVVIAHLGHARVAGGTNIEGTKLADGVAVANDQLTRFARVLLVLRNRTQRVELKNAVVIANRGVPFNHAMWAHGGARTDAHVRSDDGVRPDLHRAVELGFGVHNGCCVNEAHRLIFGFWTYEALGDGAHGAH